MSSSAHAARRQQWQLAAALPSACRWFGTPSITRRSRPCSSTTLSRSCYTGRIPATQSRRTAWASAMWRHAPSVLHSAKTDCLLELTTVRHQHQPKVAGDLSKLLVFSAWLSITSFGVRSAGLGPCPRYQGQLFAPLVGRRPKLPSGTPPHILVSQPSSSKSCASLWRTATADCRGRQPAAALAIT